MTPMFEQFHRLKAAHPDALLFFRMGDFYELFYEDAEIAASVLELTLTARNKQDPEPIPMAGVPHHAAGSYVQRLIEAGYRVAIAEQVEDPALAKGLVRREVVRVVTPGVAFDSRSLDQRVPNYVGALARAGAAYGVAVLDCSTGELRGTHLPDAMAAAAELARLEPAEVLVGPGVDAKILDRWLRSVPRSPPVPGSFEPRQARGLLAELELGGDAPEALVCAAGAVLAYGLGMSGGELPTVRVLRSYEAFGFMVVDPTTRQNLELVRTQRTQRRKGSLLHLLDRTKTAMGGRLLRDWLAFPLLEPARITRRRDAVGAFVDAVDARERVAQALKPVADIERITARVAQGTAHARDLAALREALRAMPALVDACGGLASIQGLVPADLAQDVKDWIEAWLVEEPPIALTEGGLIREGAHPELDELIGLAVRGVGVLSELEQRERDASGISSLKLKRNKVFGYYLEVTRAHLHKVPDAWLRKQTLSNCERFITPELKELEERVLGADERRRQLEVTLFDALRRRVAEHADRLMALAHKVAALDVLRALAEVAADRNWCAPELDDSRDLDIVGGRHPVVEASLRDEHFVPNDLHLDPEHLVAVLTGPNMAGKSTVMRQVALIVLLAQIGSWVPADRARIGLVDRIFTRVGASDDLGQGQSTFMVEMAETATILHEATERSLVLLDEIGRGTSTYDGLSIAWAVAEALTDTVRARTLFATHYHELCDLAEHRDPVFNLSIAVSESGDDVVFLRRLKPGGASRSYGIQCARLAGLPRPVIDRARSLLKRFEKHAPRNEREQLSLFGAPIDFDAAAEPTPAVDPGLAALGDAVRALDPDALTPRQAHEALYRLKALLGAPGG